MKSMKLLQMTAIWIALLPAVAFTNWEIEPVHTHVSFRVLHLGLTRTPGLFSKFDAKMLQRG